MQINFAHLRERATNGGEINFAVFEARANSNTDASKTDVLANLTSRARSSGLRIDQSALAYTENGRTVFFGTKNLVEYLSKRSIPHWTHKLTI
jgi:hypothetical protein